MPFIYKKADLKEGKPYITNKRVRKRLTSNRDITNFKEKWDGITLNNNKLFKETNKSYLKKISLSSLQSYIIIHSTVLLVEISYFKR